ncbi:MAG: hypothetical protein J0H88_18615 [Sphingomonadales bacterium]|nr:hypothetical protein [Sphingomonadales bacterium]
MIAVLTGCGDAGSSMQKGFEDGFKTQFTDNFTKSCQSSAGDSGLAADKIAEVCKCTADALVEKYKPDDLMGMKPEEAMPVMKECAAKSGLPV